MLHILVADDDPNIRELLKFYLEAEGYAIHEARDGKEASSILLHQQINLAVVDVMMPNKDGYELTEEIRKHYDFPIILLTSKDQLRDKEKGFSVGTDDYLTKPFEPKELLFRIRALLRRYQMVTGNKIKLHDTVIDQNSYEVNCNGQVLMLPMKEFELLAQLASYPNRIFTREELIHQIWGSDFFGDDRTVDVHIKRLRDRFTGKTDDFSIKTVRGLGYKLEVAKK
ncbi:response regulator transcription factor [Bacillus massilinigeriensis]|uniref:response regulator transcription factor n=1 Tax=Bacillus mediterraneensis TaxID=1805474 RepID=UPI0008F8B326|nr:response regulator transcription factor [Bacillus mediterraneensis]